MRLTPDTARDFVLADASADFVADPYPDLRVLLEHAPLCRQPDGSCVVSRYDDVRRVLTDSATFSSDKHVDFRPRFGDSPLYEHHTTSLVFNDPPAHTRIRALLAPFFVPRTLRRMEHSVATMVDELLDAAAQRGTIDVMAEFALQIPLNLIGDLLGVPRGDREPLRGWAALILGALEPTRTPDQLAAGNRAVEEFKGYLRELVAWKRRHPDRHDEMDILWALIRASDAGDGLTESEILHNSIFMLNAGHDTTTSLISNGVHLLLEHPAARARLLREPGLLRGAIEEMLRCESPLQFGNRRCVADTEIAGQPVPAGTFLHVAIAGANRDPRQFADADAFDVTREPNRHLAFGHGIHFCAGNAVARMEAQLAFGRLLARFPAFERAGPTVRAPRTRFRVVEELRIDLRA